MRSCFREPMVALGGPAPVHSSCERTVVTLQEMNESVNAWLLELGDFLMAA
jgi:hypothetical protein